MGFTSSEIDFIVFILFSIKFWEKKKVFLLDRVLGFGYYFLGIEVLLKVIYIFFYKSFVKDMVLMLMIKSIKLRFREVK